MCCNGYAYVMRLFAALELPADVIDSLQTWWSDTSAFFSPDGWRPVRPSACHLTLAFYGDVCAPDADDLCEHLCECAALSPMLHLRTSGFGVFPRPARPRVFWAGVQDCGEGKSLKRLAHCCRRAGHATVRKRNAREAAFRAHITLARAREQVKPVDAASMRMLPPVPDIRWSADSLSLFQSILRPQGPQYRRLEVFTLKCAHNDARGQYDR